MTSRIRIFITVLVVCHLVVAHALLTSQLTPAPAAASQAPPRQSEEVTIKAQSQEEQGGVYKLKGDVQVTSGTYTLHADEVTYDSNSGEVTAEGHLIFEGGPNDEHLEGSHGTYNVRSDSGTFWDVTGTTGVRFRGKHVLLTSSNPFFFRGVRVDKVGPDHFVVSRGMITSCTLPNPKWTFNASRITVEVGDQARMYHSTFRLGGLPIFYFPYAQHPVEKIGRQSGFLIPSAGQSSTKGTIIGDSFYWAINRSMDATMGAEYFSKRGWAQHGDFRARPSDTSYLNATYFGVLDRGIGTPPVDQGGEEVRLNGEAKLAYQVRAVADIDYLSSFVFRQAFTESFTQAVNSEARSNLFVSKNTQGYFFNILGSRYQNFESTTRGDVITILHAPSLDLDSVDHQIARTPLYWSYDVAAQGVSRREPDFVTDNLVGRFDVYPRVSLPLLVGGWSLRPEVAVRDTYYTQDLAANGALPQPGADAVNRRALEGVFELRPPALGRIFDRKVLGRIIKHTIEPRFTYTYTTGIDNFDRIIRFDARDILSNTNEVEYAIVNRLYAKSPKDTDCTRPGEVDQDALAPEPLRTLAPSLEQSLAGGGSAGCKAVPAAAREVVTWEIAQKAFFNEDFGGAVVQGQRNVLETTAEFSGIAFLTDPRRFSPIISRLRFDTGHHTDVQWNLDYDTRKGYINASTALVNYRFGDWFIAGSHAFMRVPGEIVVPQPTPGPTQFNQFRWLVGYGNPNKRGINAAANIGFDIDQGFVQYSAFQSSYNWDCCGVSFEYRRFALGAVRNENQFRFALTLSNVGTFGNLRRQERLF